MLGHVVFLNFSKNLHFASGVLDFHITWALAWVRQKKPNYDRTFADRSTRRCLLLEASRVTADPKPIMSRRSLLRLTIWPRLCSNKFFPRLPAVKYWQPETFPKNSHCPVNPVPAFWIADIIAHNTGVHDGLFPLPLCPKALFISATHDGNRKLPCIDGLKFAHASQGSLNWVLKRALISRRKKEICN